MRFLGFTSGMMLVGLWLVRLVLTNRQGEYNGTLRDFVLPPSSQVATAAGAVPRNPKPVDVEDPYQLSDVIYNATFERVRDGVEWWAGKIPLISCATQGH